jgi:7-keto-8-aminopelargonate synthetase-like enzyme
VCLPYVCTRAGIRLCKAQRRRYKHLDLVDLEEQLKASSGNRLRLIVTDGVFSMDGDVAPLQKICELAEKYVCVSLPTAGVSRAIPCVNVLCSCML